MFIFRENRMHSFYQFSVYLIKHCSTVLNIYLIFLMIQFEFAEERSISHDVTAAIIGVPKTPVGTCGD